MRPLKTSHSEGDLSCTRMETIFKFQQIDMKAKGTSQ